MTSRLRDALDDLATDVPRHVLPPDLAGRAWAAGRRRRWRRRLAGSVLAMVLAALVWTAIVPLTGELRTVAPAGTDAGVGGYPERIGYQWWVRELPDRPGPVAALIEVDGLGRYGQWLGVPQRGHEWHAVSQRGQRWRLVKDEEGSDPMISPDGRYLGYLTDRYGPYVLHDLVAGDRVEFPEIGLGLMDPRLPRFGVYVQQPSFWAPDGQRVLVQVSDKSDGERVPWLVLGVDGSMTPAAPTDRDDEWRGFVAGWTGDEAVHVLTWTPVDPDDRESPVAEVAIRTVSLDGVVRHTRPLEPSTPWRADSFNQWSGVVSPDGSQLLVIEDDGSWSPRVRGFSLADGTELWEPIPVVEHVSTCPAAWTDTGPAMPVFHHGGGAVTAVPMERWDTPTFEPFVAVAPGLGSGCILWASDAVASAPNSGAFALLSDTAWTQPWRQLHSLWWPWLWRDAATLLVLAAAGIVGRRWWRRRRRRRTTTGAGPGSVVV